MKIQLTESDLRYMVMEVINELMMNEIELSEPVKDGEPVCIFVGRFQPFTKGHLACIESVMKNKGIKTFILTSKGNGKPEKPIVGDVQMEMLNRIKDSHSDIIAGIDFGRGADICANAAKIRNEYGYEPVAWITGSDHEAAYKTMIMRYGKELKLSPNFDMIILGRDPEDSGVAGVSATKVRDAIINGNEREFDRMVPEELHDMFNQFRDSMLKH